MVQNEVSRLYAICDFEGYRGNVRDYRVAEYVELACGNLLLLRDGLGWSVESRGGNDFGTSGLQQVYADVLFVVQPEDDSSDAGSEHPWHLLAATMRKNGIPASAESIRHLPYDVLLTSRLATHLFTNIQP